MIPKPMHPISSKKEGSDLAVYLLVIWLILMGLVVLVMPAEAKAAGDWDAVDDFESYSATTISGQSGGTNWAGAWSSDHGEIWSTYVNTGSQSLHLPSTAGTDSSHGLSTNVTSGIVSFYMFEHVAGDAGKGMIAVFNQSGSGKFYVYVGASGSANVSFCGGSCTEILPTITADHWYHMRVKFDQADNCAQISVDDSEWSSCIAPAGGSYTSITALRVTTGDGTTGDAGYAFDDVSVGDEPGGGGGGGGGGEDATTTATSTLQYIDNPVQDLWNGIILFLISMGGMVWFFKKKA